MTIDRLIKSVSTITSALMLTGCAFAFAGDRDFSSVYDQFVQARVVTIEPIRSTTYHRAPKTSCTTVVIDDRITERCHTYQDNIYSSRIEKYKVTFEYRGIHRTVIMRHDPGTHVNLKVVTNVYVLE